MREKNRKWILVLLVICLLFGTLVIGKRFLEHESWQTQQISYLLEENARNKEEIIALKEEVSDAYIQIASLWQKTYELEEMINCEVEYEADACNYLAIGNSITLHPTGEYWWDEMGMAATGKEKDFVHLVSKYLEEQYGKEVTYAVCYAMWEVQSYDRAETYTIIDPYLSSELDLVTIQLGENVYDITDYKSDYIELINYVQSKCPNAQIIIVDDFWPHAERIAIKKEVAEEMGVSLADLSEIREKPEYKSEIGTIVYGADGEAHRIEHSGTAEHPGDLGMEYIADRIIDLIQIKEK